VPKKYRKLIKFHTIDLIGLIDFAHSIALEHFSSKCKTATLYLGIFKRRIREKMALTQTLLITENL
jgi:hypothetical protein